MGRILKRVPFDFNYPIDKVWEGYCPSLEKLQSIPKMVEQVPEILNYKGNVCNECDKTFNDCSESARYCVWYNEDLRNLWHYEVPKGEGYQMWENTSEGSPQSPVFKTLEALCEWCAEHATVFANFKATKEEWMQMLGDDSSGYRMGNVIIF